MCSYVEKSTFTLIYFIRKTSTSAEDQTCISFVRRGIQASSCIGPEKPNLPFELRGKAGGCTRVTAGPRDLIYVCVRDLTFLSREDRDLREKIHTQTHHTHDDTCVSEKVT